MNLDNIIIRLKSEEGENFASCIPYRNDQFSGAFHVAMNTLDMEKIVRILKAKDSRIIEVILEKGLKYSFTAWQNINLNVLPSNLLHSFPIEVLPQNALSMMNIDSVVRCVLARVEGGHYRNLSILLTNLSPEFWSHPAVMANHNFRFILSCFHMGNFEAYRLLSETESTSLDPKVIYAAPYCYIVEYLLGSNVVKRLEQRTSIQKMYFNALKDEFRIYYYVVQTYLHEFLSKGFLEVPLFNLFVTKIKALRRLIYERSRAFPEEDDLLYSILVELDTCYSIELYEQKDNSNVSGLFDTRIPVIYKGIAKVKHFLNEKILPVTEVDLSLYLMNAKENGPSEFNGEVDWFVEEGINKETFTQPILRNSVLIKSLSRNFIRNRKFADILLKNFSGETSHYEFLSRAIANDWEYLKRLDVNDVNAQAKFFAHFSNAFVEKTSQEQVIPITSTRARPNRFAEKLKVAKEVLDRDEFNSAGRAFGNASSNMQSQFQLPNMSKTVTIPLHITTRLPEISSSLLDSSSNVFDEYVHFKQFFETDDELDEPMGVAEVSDEDDEHTEARPFPKRIKRGEPNSHNVIGSTSTEGATEIVIEMDYVQGVLSAIGKALQFPMVDLKFEIIGSTVSGSGILHDSLATFGRLISLTRFKTIQYVEAIDGFVPMPLLSPKVMGMLGGWIAICLKYKVPLAWNFASNYRKFLFRDYSVEDEDVVMDLLMEEMYVDLFDFIRKFYMYEAYRDEDDYLLPKRLIPHIPFNLPAPYNAKASPFLLENRFLDACKKQKTFASHEVSIEQYFKFLKHAIKDLLLEGRAEFQKQFSVFFKPEFIQHVQFRFLDEYLRGRRVEPEELSAALVFNGFGQELKILDDFEGGSGEELDPSALMKLFVSKLTTDQLAKFVWFVTGSSQTPLSGFQNYKISFSAVVASREPGNSFFYCKARVCFKMFTLVIHNNSAKDTFDRFLESVTMTAGFSNREV